MNNYAVIFDMDGVICHTNPYHAQAFELFFKKYNIESTEKEFEEHLYGKHNSYIMEYFFKRPIDPVELIALEEEKESLFRTIYSDKVEPINGFKAFLTELKNQNFKLGVATSAPEKNMDLILDALEIRTTMNSLLSSEDVTLHKPAPEVYLKSAENLQIAPNNCVVFEDSASGITAASRAGMTVIGVLTTHKKEELPPCSFYINDYTEITVDIIHAINKGLDF